MDGDLFDKQDTNRRNEFIMLCALAGAISVLMILSIKEGWTWYTWTINKRRNIKEGEVVS